MRHKHCLLAILALTLSPLAAPAVEKPLLLDRSLIDNVRLFGAGTHTITKPIVIPRTNGVANGTFPYTNPANEIAGVHGLGATTSILRCDIQTGPFITTEGYDTGTTPYTAEVTGLTIKGPDNHDMGQFPWGTPGNPPTDYVTTGVELDAVECIVSNCQIRLVRGYGVTMGQSMANGYYLAEYRIESCRFAHCYTAIKGRTDGRYFNNIVSGCRDYCLYVPQNTGSVQSGGNHYYGAAKAIYVANAEGFHSTNDVFSDAEYGLHLTGYSHSALVTGGFSQHCWARGVDAESNYNSFLNCSVDIPQNNDTHADVVAVELAGRGNQFLGGQVSTSATEENGATHDTVPPGGTAFLISNDGYSGQSGDNRIETAVLSPTGVGGGSRNDICLRFADASTGNQIDIMIPYGFAHADSRLLVVDVGVQAGLKGNTITFRGRDLGAAVAKPANYVDIAAGGLDATNVVKIIDSSTGKSVTLKPGQAY